MYVQPICQVHVRTAATAKQAWDNLHKVFDNKDIGRRVLLKRRSSRATLNNFSDMSAYVNEKLTVCQDQNELGCPLEGDEIAVTILAGLPEE